MEHCDVLIIGGGASGMAAAASASREGAGRVLLVERWERLGGILPQCVHEGFGLERYGVELTGPEYSRRLEGELLQTDAEILLNTAVLSLSPEKKALLSGRERGLVELEFEHVILATGCREVSIGALPIAGTRPAGVFTAGQAQEMINLHGQCPGDEVLILGSGDLGLIMARRFALMGKRVVAVVEKEAHCGGTARNRRRCIDEQGLPLILSATVTEVFGNERVEAVTLLHLDTGKTERVPCQTLVTAAGLVPERELVSGLPRPLPDWLHLCGNCERVHEIVDSAVRESEKLGAELVKTKGKEI